MSKACQVVVDQVKQPDWIWCSKVSRRTVSRLETKTDLLTLLDLRMRHHLVTDPGHRTYWTIIPGSADSKNDVILMVLY